MAYDSKIGYSYGRPEMNAVGSLLGLEEDSTHHGGEQAGLRGDRLCAGVQQQEAAGAVGVLGLQRPAALPQQCRVLVA